MEALRLFILGIGDSTKNVNMDISTLWALNRQKIDQSVPRYFAIKKEHTVQLCLTDVEHIQRLTVPRHKKNKTLGEKELVRCKTILLSQSDASVLKEGDEITLMDWGNIIISTITKTGGVVSTIQAHLHLQGDFKKTDHKFQWLPSDESVSLLTVELVDFDHIITHDKLPPDGELKDFVNQNSKRTTLALADPNVACLKVGDKLQFERVGYFIVDKIQDGKMVFVEIPTGHTKQVFGK